MDEFNAQSADHPTSRWRSIFRKKLLTWYAEHQRDLPWRSTTDAYRIWVSETMLQQTQVATVVEYYKRFLDRFPTILDLADASEQEVLRLWAGLGYYRRARQLHAAAQLVAQKLGGKLPTTTEELMALPGIGRYTAGAIASFAHDQKAPILEANTLRLFCRLMGMRENPRSGQGQKRLWEFAESILPNRSGAGRVNQAAMELGSLVCKPREPDCENCPVQALCPTAALGLQEQIPLLPQKAVATHLNHAATIVLQDGPGSQRQLLMRRNPPGTWWAGLWDVPRVDVTSGILASDGQSMSANVIAGLVARRMLTDFQLALAVSEHALTIHHGVTRYRIQLDCFYAKLDAAVKLSATCEPFQWIKARDVETLPVSSTTRKIIAFLGPRLQECRNVSLSSSAP